MSGSDHRQSAMSSPSLVDSFPALRGHLILPRISVTLSATSEEGRRELEIDEPFLATVCRIEGVLHERLREIGDRMEPTPNHASRSEGSSHRWYARLLPKRISIQSESECLDVVRPQPDGSTLRLYSVTISRDTEPGTTKVDIEHYQDAGEEGIKAAREAKEAIRLATKGDEYSPIALPPASAETLPSGPITSPPIENNRLDTAVERAVLQHETKERQRISTAFARGLSPAATWDEIEELDKAERALKDSIIHNLLDALASGALKYERRSDGSIFLLSIQQPVRRSERSAHLLRKAYHDELETTFQRIVSSSEPDSVGELLSEILMTGVEYTGRVESDEYTLGKKKIPKGFNCWFLDFYLPANEATKLSI